MIQEYLYKYKLNLVVLGDFNPAIFSPAWLALKKLIRPENMEDTQVHVIHGSFSLFRIGDWAEIKVNKETFQLTTAREDNFDLLKDLMVGIFTILKETPIRAFGINHNKYFTVPDENRYNKIENKLAPLGNWNEIFSDPKLMRLEILQLKRPDSNMGRISFSVSLPDEEMPKNTLKVFMNDRFDIDDKIKSTEKFLKIFEKSFKSSFEQFDGVIDSVWRKIN